jgi:hypothetical protein
MFWRVFQQTELSGIIVLTPLKVLLGYRIKRIIVRRIDMSVLVEFAMFPTDKGRECERLRQKNSEND